MAASTPTRSVASASPRYSSTDCAWRSRVEVGIGVAEVATEGGHGANARIGDAAQGLAQQRPVPAYRGMALDVAQPREAADHQLAVAIHLHRAVLLANLPQADQAGRAQHAGLHHQHHGRAAAHSRRGRDRGCLCNCT